MAVPRNRHSDRRQATRRAHFKLQPKTTTACRQCGASKLPHRVCPSCGMYRGRAMVQPAEPV
ncbi:MAG: 50S ribosomal protein L32 [Verrucomicrobia bacterium]|nr:50S ribosomal protein L32 [Verrucomicrobiota bacterium]